MGVMSKQLELSLGVLEIGIKVVEEGVMFVGDLGLRDIIIESDAQLMVKSLGKQSVPPSSINLVVEGIKERLKGFNAWEVSHTRRNGNKVAHILARQAKFPNDCNIQVEDTLPKIVDQIQIDVAQCNRISS